MSKTLTPTRPEAPETVAAPRPQQGRTRWLAIAAAATVAVTTIVIALIVSWAIGTETTTPPEPTRSDPPAAYQPGGSVHDQQVPDFQHWTLVYGPGGSVYKSQVPHGR